MAEKIKAIVIKSNDRKEKDVNVLLFSIERGKIWATLKGVKSPNAKMKMAQNTFAFGEFVLEEGKAGYVVTSFELLESFHEITEDLNKYFESAALLEVTNALDFENESERAKVFVLLLKTLKVICFGSLRKNYALCKFLVELLKILGLPLYTDKCSVCGNKAMDKIYVNLDVGELVCSLCKNFSAQEVSRGAFLTLKIIDSTDFDRLSTVKFSGGSELQLLKILANVFDEHFDIHLKFMGVLS